MFFKFNFKLYIFLSIILLFYKSIHRTKIFIIDYKYQTEKKNKIYDLGKLFFTIKILKKKIKKNENENTFLK
tara:strand:- start:157 stop:372 length:216 start_codon:yes stop_codon:yes gene_type:complete